MNRQRASHFLHVLSLLVLGAAAAPVLGQGGAQPEAPVEAPARALLRELCSAPRVAGTCGSLWGARLCARWLADAGWQVEIDSRQVLLSLPRRIELAIYASAWEDEPLSERIERYDPDAIPPGDIPKCNAWSASGVVKALVVDAGHGTRADFGRLKKLGVDPRGTIALIRYGKSYRGVKVDLAQQHGCAAVLLFSEGDGAEKGTVWPTGPWKPEWEAQRGSILPIAKVPGDPATPGWPSSKPGEANARRISGAELDDSLPKIPCVPIGLREARELIGRLASVEVVAGDGTKSMQHLGPGPVQVRLTVDQPRDLRVIHNVIARLPGEVGKTVIAGGHRDAWVRGANDNGAGTVALVRAAQLLGERARAGWKPKHTIAIGLWDAEEFGLIGSTEWAEAHAKFLAEHGLAYINLDASIDGPRFRGASGSPGTLDLLKTVLERIPCAPRDEGESAPANLWEEWRARLKVDDADAEPRLSLPGSGSDFAVFLHHLNLPVLEFGFGGSRGGGGYHTAFDDFTLVDRHIDPGFVGHELGARLLAELLTEISERGSAFYFPAEAALEMARRAREAGRELSASTGTATPAPAPDDSNTLDAEAITQGFERLAQAFEKSAAALGETRQRAVAPGQALAEGLPGRTWFQNQLWAPGLEDGYGSETFPLLRTAAGQGREEFERSLAALIRAVDETEANSVSPAGH